MLDRVNSRRLNKFDTYSRRFDMPGTYHYRIAVLGADLECGPSGPVYELVVNEQPVDKARQHVVRITHDTELRRYQAEPERLSINRGDLVLWYKPDKPGVDYAIVGASERDAFDSRRLGIFTVYTHTFRQVGTYRYEDVYHDGGKPAGIVRVVSAGKDREAWCKRVASPPVVTYANGKFTPDEIEVVELGAVVWSVEDDAGVSVVIEPGRREGKVARRTVQPRRRIGSESAS